MFVRFILPAALLLLTLTDSYAAWEPRGIRSNNPGNIVKSSITWVGEVECTDRVNECFKNEYYGIRAMAVVLNNYYHRRGMRSVEAVVRRWGPSEPRYERNVQNYIKLMKSSYVDTACGMPRHEALTQLIAGIIHFENGYNPYKEEYIRLVVMLAIPNTNERWECADYKEAEYTNEQAIPDTVSRVFNVVTTAGSYTGLAYVTRVRHGDNNNNNDLDGGRRTDFVRRRVFG